MAYKINDLTGLGRNLDPTDLLEVSLAGGTGSRKITGSQIANAIGGANAIFKPVTGLYQTQFLLSGGFDYSFYGAANFMQLAAYSPASTYTTSEMTINCTSSVVGQEVKILIYSDSNGVPSTNLLTSTALLMDTTGLKTYTVSFTFEAGKKYWIGIIQKTNGSAMMSGGYTANLYPIYTNNSFNTFNAISSTTYTYSAPASTISIANFSAFNNTTTASFPMIIFKPA